MFLVDAVTSSVGSLLRVRHGVKRKVSARAARPENILELYSFEGCPMCRLVRERLTELDLDYIHRSCPRGHSPNRSRLLELGGKMQVPYLVDPNTGVSMYESADIIKYLDRTYG